MNVNPVKNPNSAECIRCGECVKTCPKGALKLGIGAGCNRAGSNALQKS